MKEFLDNTKIKTRDLVLKHAHGTRAKWWLFWVSFSESSFLVLPTDTFLIAILMAGANRWIYYSGLASVASVLGGIFGYILGFWFFQTFGDGLISFYSLEVGITKATLWYDQNAFWAIFVSGLVPVIPYKIFSLTAGILNINFGIFVLASILSRSLRFFAVGYIVKLYGSKMGEILFKYFNIISVAVLFVIFILIILSWG